MRIFRKKLKGFNKRQLRSRRAYIAYGLLSVIVASLIIQVVQPFAEAERYELTTKARTIIGESRDDATDYLSLNKQNGGFEFAVPDTAKTEGTSNHYGRNADAYTTSLPQKAKEGITYTDTASKISVTVAPKFRTGDGQKVKGDHIVYPFGASQLVYTHKYNGLKEDIIIPKFIDDTMDYKFELRLPSGVEARLDDAGNIGIYSADQTLFGDISYSTDDDRKKLDKARQNSEKTNLVATIPAPIVKDSEENEYFDRASFELSDSKSLENNKVTQNIQELKITAKNLEDLAYPISVDPTIQTTSASDFALGENEGGVTVDNTLSQVRRSSVTGGDVETWTATTSSPYTGATQSAVYNGRIYVANGVNPIMMATINAGSGAIGTYSSAGQNSQAGSVFIHRGYFYFLGTGSGFNEHVYSKINALGTLNPFVATGPNSLADRINAAATIYDGFAYLAGGNNAAGTTRFNSVQYAAVNADGTFAAWQTAAATLGAEISIAKLVGYNNRLYLVGGVISTGATATASYALLSDGVPQSWISLTSLPVPIYDHALQVNNGYLYAYGGWNGSAGSDRATLYYSAIYENGMTGPWQTGTSVSIAARRSFGSAIVNDKLYIIAGQSGNNGSGGPTTLYQDSQYSAIRSAGYSAPAVISGQNFPATRYANATVVSNGYIYVIGGCTTTQNNCQGATETTLYATISSTGLIGTWTAGTSLPEAWGFQKAVVVNGFIYVFGGLRSNGIVTLGTFNTYWTELNRFTGEIGIWNATGNTAGSPGSIPEAVGSYGVAVHKGYVYITGGSGGTAGPAISSNTHVATLGNGAPGVFQTYNTGMTPRAFHASAVWGDKLYVWGGQSSGITGATSTFLDTIQYTSLFSSDGSIQPWQTASIILPEPVTKHAGFIDKGYLYVVGGSTASGATELPTVRVRYARIGITGDISSTREGGSLSFNRLFNQAALIPGKYIITGGCTGRNTETANCGSFGVPNYSGAMNNGGPGSTGSFSNTSSFMDGRYGHSSSVHKGYLYILGGYSDTGTVNDVQYALINADGSIGPWNYTTALPQQMGNHKSVAYNGFMYVSGGLVQGSGATNAVIVAAINANGTLESWTTTTSLPSVLYAHTMNFNNGYVYITGGYIDTQGDFATAAVRYAVINLDGTLGAWLSASSLYGPLSHHAAVISGNYIYVIGGNTEAGDTNQVLSTLIFSNGNLASWKDINSMTDKRSGHAAVVSNGLIYVIGGYSNAYGLTNAVSIAAISTSGYIGAWQDSTPQNVERYYHTSVDYNGNIYSMGGIEFFGHLSSVEYANMQTISRKGTYSRFVDFDKGVRPTKLITRGFKEAGGSIDVTYSTSNNAATTLDSPQTAKNIGFDGANKLLLSLEPNKSISKYLLLRYSIDDRLASVFPDHIYQSNITEYDIYFDPNPGSRLRGGQTFTGGVNRGLQAN